MSLTDAATVTWDGKSFFQMLSHKAICERAAQSGFCDVLLRLTLAIYRGPRRLSYQGLVASQRYANRGVVPGCSIATTIVKVYCLQPFDCFCRDFPETRLDAYIDDFQLSAAGPRKALICSFLSAAKGLRSAIQDGLGVPLASEKAAVVATSAELTRTVRDALGEDGGRSELESAITLGIDFDAGRRRPRLKGKWTAMTKRQKEANQIIKRTVHFAYAGAENQGN